MSSQKYDSVALVILYVFFGLLIGNLIKSFSKNTKVPYTPTILLIGLMIGAISQFGVITISFELVSNISGIGFMMLLLPVLLFESGYNVNTHLVGNQIWKIFWLVGPGVIYSAVLIAITLKYIIQYRDDEFTFITACTLGSILATTDPVAVVALLKSLGAPEEISTLIELESLVNDGTASVLFTIFLNIAEGQAVKAGPLIGSIFKLIVASPFLGIGFALVSHYWSKRIIRDSKMLINIIFVTIYLLYFTAEGLHYGMSPILALVAYGITMGVLAKKEFREEHSHTIHLVLSYGQFVCETMIFYIAGTIVGIIISQLQSFTIEGSDWWKLIALYLIMNVIRFSLCVGTLPILNLSGFKLEFKSSIIAGYAGLRGALSLALSMIVFSNDHVPQRTKDLTIFLTAGIAVLTLCINGTTTNFLIKLIKPFKEAPIKERLKNKFEHRIISLTKKEIQKLKNNRFFQATDWKTVEEQCEQIYHLQSNKKKLKKNPLSRSSNFFIGDEFEKLTINENNMVLKEYRIRILTLLRNMARESYDKHMITFKGYNAISEAIDNELDISDKPLDIWNHLTSRFSNIEVIQKAMKYKNKMFIGYFISRWIFKELEHIYEICILYLTIFPECLNTMISIIHTSEKDMPAVNEFQTEIEANIEQAEFYFSLLEENFQEMINKVQTKRAGILLMNEQKSLISKHFHEGYLEENQYEQYMHKIETELIKLEKKVLAIPLPKDIDYILNVPTFAFLSDDDIHEIKNNSKLKDFRKDIMISEAGKPTFFVYVVLKGLLEDNFLGPTGLKSSLIRGVGSLIGLVNVIEEDEKSLTNVIALKPSKVLEIPIDLLRNIMKLNENFRAACYQMTAVYFVKLFPNKAGTTAIWPEHKVIQTAYNSKLRVIDRGVQLKLLKGGFLIKGKIMLLQENGDTLNYQDFCYLAPEYRLYQVIENCEILDFSKKIEIWKKEEKNLYSQRQMTFINKDLMQKVKTINEARILARQPSLVLNKDLILAQQQLILDNLIPLENNIGQLRDSKYFETEVQVKQKLQKGILKQPITSQNIQLKINSPTLSCSRGIGKQFLKILNELPNIEKVIYTCKSQVKGDSIKEELNLGEKFQNEILELKSKISMIELREKLQKLNILFDVIISNAGCGDIKDFGEHQKMPRGYFVEIMETNFVGTIAFNEIFKDLLKKDGKLIITSSELGRLHNLGKKSQQFLAEKRTLNDLVKYYKQFEVDYYDKKDYQNISPSIYHLSKALLNNYAKYTLPSLLIEEQQIYTFTPGWIKTDTGSNLAQKNIQEGTRVLEHIIWNIPFQKSNNIYCGQFIDENKDIGNW